MNPRIAYFIVQRLCKRFLHASKMTSKQQFFSISALPEMTFITLDTYTNHMPKRLLMVHESFEERESQLFQQQSYNNPIWLTHLADVQPPKWLNLNSPLLRIESERIKYLISAFSLSPKCNGAVRTTWLSSLPWYVCTLSREKYTKLQ